MARILIVDDDEKIVRMLVLRLGQKGYEIDSVGNGQACVDRLKTERYDLVLMDMHMPIMDGHEAVRTLRARGYVGVILAVTASAMSLDSKKALESGCDDYIAKPIGHDFEERIAAYLERGNAGASSKAVLSADELDHQRLEIKDRFMEELPQRYQVVFEDFMALEKAVDKVSALDTFYKSLHSLLGSSATFGLDEVESISREIEVIIKPSWERQSSDAIHFDESEVMEKLVLLRGLCVT